MTSYGPLRKQVLGASLVGTCSDCAKGTYGTGSGYPASTRCTLCPPGSYSGALGASAGTTCSACAAGTYGTGSGMPATTNCTLCIPGLYSATLGASSATSCTICAPGTFSTGSGMPAASDCALCRFPTASPKASSFVSNSFPKSQLLWSNSLLPFV